MCEHTRCWCAYRPRPVVIHETEFLCECIEFVGFNHHIGSLCSVMKHGLINRVRESLAAGQRHDLVVVHASPGDKLVDHTALFASLVFVGVEQFGVDSFVDNHIGDLHVEMSFGEGVLHCPYFLSQHSLELALAYTVAIDDEPPRQESVKLFEAFQDACHAACDFGTQFFFHILHLDFTRLLAEVLIETCSEAHDAAAVSVPHVDATHHCGYIGAFRL